MKIKLELNITEEAIFLNFWDAMHGNDVVCEVVNGQLVRGEERVTLSEFIEAVKDAAS